MLISLVCLGLVKYGWSGVPFELYCKQMGACAVSACGQSPDAWRKALILKRFRGRQRGTDTRVEEHQLSVLGLETYAHSKQYSHNGNKTSRSKKKKKNIWCSGWDLADKVQCQLFRITSSLKPGKSNKLEAIIIRCNQIIKTTSPKSTNNVIWTEKQSPFTWIRNHEKIQNKIHLEC